MSDATILLAGLSAAAGAVGALVTAWFTGRASARKSVSDADTATRASVNATDAGTTERALRMVDELRIDFDRLQARTVILEGQYHTLWNEHVALQKEHARVSAELARSEGRVGELRKRVAELERAADALTAKAKLAAAAEAAAVKVETTAAHVAESVSLAPTASTSVAAAVVNVTEAPPSTGSDA